MKNKLLILFVFLSIANANAQTQMQTPLKSYLDDLKKLAQNNNSAFTDFSYQRGEQLYSQKFNHQKKPISRNCSTCHSSSPTASGKTRVGKTIKPLSPSINPKRFTKIKKVKKWFKRNCKWTLGKKCSAQQKGDFIYYLFNKRDI